MAGVEAFTDPRTGVRQVRRHLDTCRAGRLYLCPRSQGSTDLL